MNESSVIQFPPSLVTVAGKSIVHGSGSTVMNYCDSFVGEASGDSEADSDPYAAVRREVSTDVIVEDNEEDAQSCVYDSRGVSCTNGSVFVDDEEEAEEEVDEGEDWCGDDRDHRYQMDFCENAVVRPDTIGEEDEEDEEEEDGVVNEKIPKSNVLITEMEDRLFWETCLATGY